MTYAVGIILVDKGCTGCWMSRRLTPGDYHGFLQTPGGAVNDGESVMRAAHRELREETGVRLAKYALRTVHTGDYVKPSGGLYCASMLAGVCPDDRIPECKEPDKSTAWQFYTWEAIENTPEVMESTRDGIRQLLQALAP